MMQKKRWGDGYTQKFESEKLLTVAEKSARVAL